MIYLHVLQYNYLIISGIVALFALISIINTKNSFLRKTSQFVKGGTYCIVNLKNQSVDSSKELRKLLHLKTTKNKLDDIVSCLEEDHGKEFVQFCHSEQIVSIIVQLKKETSVKPLFLLCQKTYHSHRSRNNFFIMMSDITSWHLKHKVLMQENILLKKDLVQKNNILNTLPIPIWFRDENLNIMYFNNAYNQIISDIHSESQEINEISKKEKLLASKAQKYKTLQKEERYIVANSTRNLYEFQEVPVYNSNNMVGFAYDITSKDEVRAELKMHVSAQSDLLESSANACAIYDSRTRLMFFNQAFIKLWNLDEKWLVTNPTYGEVLESLRERRQLPEQLDFRMFKSEQLKLFNNVMSPHNDFFFLPDGRYLRVIAIPYALGGLLFSYEDITDKLTMEREFKTLSAVQKETIDHLNEGISVFSESGRLQLSNKQFAEMWQLDPIYLKSKPHITAIVTALNEHITSGNTMDMMLHALNSRNRNKITINTRRNKVIDVMIVPLPDGATMISYSDITDSTLVETTLIEKNQALQDADNLKTEFLANVSYELRSPLTSILGFAQALDKNYCGKLNQLQAEYISNIHDSSQYLMTLINDLLDLASIDAGYIQLDVVKLNIYDLMTSIMELVKERAKSRKIKLSMSCDDTIKFMEGDKKIIKQILFKILSNAIENSKAQQIIKFYTKRTQSDQIKFVVDDNSTILSEQERQYIFEPFKKFDIRHINARNSSLGMALVKNFVSLHNGFINVKLKENKGMIFEITLPYSQNNIIMETADKKLITHLP